MASIILVGGIVGDFDAVALWAAVDRQLEERAMSLGALNAELHWMAYKTFLANRERGGGASCQHLWPVVQWVGRTPESFTVGGDDFPGELLPDPRPGRWRWYLDMPALVAALDHRRIERDLTWSQVAEELGATPAEVASLRKSKYGTTLSLATRSTRWAGRTVTSLLWEMDGGHLPWSTRRTPPG